MPSKQTNEASDENASVDFIEELVAAIDHNLRLKSRQHSSLCKQKRVSPYVLPDSRNKVNNEDSDHRLPDCCKHCSKTYSHSLKHKKGNCASAVEDPYERLQHLLREGTLIKEAVKRLQCGLDHPKSPKTPPYEVDSELEHHNSKLYAI